ncbi:MAG: DUF4388 domain-containing protein, partial [Candidatus Latescibacterota bacterium]
MPPMREDPLPEVPRPRRRHEPLPGLRRGGPRPRLASVHGPLPPARRHQPRPLPAGAGPLLPPEEGARDRLRLARSPPPFRVDLSGPDHQALPGSPRREPGASSEPRLCVALRPLLSLRPPRSAPPDEANLPRDRLREEALMGLRGNLSHFGVADVLQLLAGQAKSGTVRITRPGEQAAFVLEAGAIVSTWDRASSASDPLKSFLLRRGVLPENQVMKALRLESHTELSFGEILLREGMMDLPELSRHLTEQIREEIRRVLAWDDGLFEFVPEIRVRT